MAQPIITTSLVRLDAEFGPTPADVISSLTSIVSDAGRTEHTETLFADAMAREKKSSTGVPGGIAIPHCRSESIHTPTLAFVRLKKGVDFGAPDGTASLIFLIAAPADGGKEHLKILSKLARALVRKDFIEALENAASETQVVNLVNRVIHPAPDTDSPTVSRSSEATTNDKNQVISVVAVTACPTGIAHTYMAADALSQEASKRNDIELAVETQGSSAVTPLSQETITAADVVIFATDVGVKDRERFAGKPLIESGVKRAINEPVAMLEEAILAAHDPQAYKVPGTSSYQQTTHKSASNGSLSLGKKVQQSIMTGVSYMVPFVAAGGLLLALGFLFGGYDIADGWKTIASEYSITNLPSNAVTINGSDITFDRSGLLLYLGAVLFATGQAAMSFIVAALSGYIAYALAGRPGIAPGFVGGAISVTLGAGFIGGLVTGLLAGVIALWISSWKTHRIVQSLMPVVIIPLLTSLFIGLIMFLLLGRPLSAVMMGLQNWLGTMSGSSAVLLGIILGLMMCFDLGGPVNKAAYLFATAGLSTGDQASLQIMAAVMAAGMVPPIALSLATLIRKNLFTPVEQENGKSAWLLGLSFVSEGAIPFAAADPLRVIPSMMLGGAVTGAITMATHTISRAPHGGIFVSFAIEPFWGFILGIASGVLVSAFSVIALKSFWPNNTTQQEAAQSQT
ncbi:PTS fructose transporter subunit IIABC [Corynebacterium pseudotuberculosis]|uniref:PTS fructose transporter subunit IIABC n=1 Tax=Corynebacterium pseudotuberculosis TaxID=1719 RepID=UPI0009785B06|nr:fructose-specific PTS transporter subunit EIIC [Corynebacterium pseudotuberculosis]AFB72589.2 PTS lactose transporter subunit IIC [Corynebacterium pseudotuberculosis 316]ASC75575.1 PTS lactose transporter subunit IIC [Corynebacterium pseudotuberculosis]AUY60690.1 PTS system fructose-specific transporter subunit IIABC [Corynebacterium pseudotuberculosis]WAE78102.1 fructose-specific PTS transporter subunit EIIC [Corynebacterium pseudotuberculosis]WAE80151.1 fructose-specific PTS transporter s